MNEQKPTRMTTSQRMELAHKINELIEAAYPEDKFFAQEEALILALQARTSAADIPALLGR